MPRLLGDKIWVWLAITAQIVVTVALLWPALDLPQTDVPMADKWAHFLVFSVLFYLWAQALSVKNQIRRLSVKLVIALIFYGTIIEVIQDSWSISRTGDFMDVLANTIGILMGLIVFNIKEKLSF